TLLDRLGVLYSTSDRGFTIRDRQVCAALLEAGEGSKNKVIPQEHKELEPGLLLRLLSGYLAGDGWRAGSGWQVETMSGQLADDLLEIGSKLGFNVRIMSNLKNSYRVSLSTGNIGLDKRNWKTKENWRGRIFGVTVPNGTIFVRRNGCCCWTGNSENSQRLWDEMTPPPTRSVAIRWVVTYAGFKGESTLLWDIYESVVGSPRVHTKHRVPGTDLPIYQKGSTLVFWSHEPRQPWQTDRYYARQKNNLRPSAYVRLHENKWVQKESAFVPVSDWDLCIDA
ncbi:unnamed protein product, partial [marine sediment metagenome]